QLEHRPADRRVRVYTSGATTGAESSPAPVCLLPDPNFAALSPPVDPKLRDAEVGVGIDGPDDVLHARIEEQVRSDLEHRLPCCAIECEGHESAEGLLGGRVDQDVGADEQMTTRLAEDTRIYVEGPQICTLQSGDTVTGSVTVQDIPAWA